MNLDPSSGTLSLSVQLWCAYDAGMSAQEIGNEIKVRGTDVDRNALTAAILATRLFEKYSPPSDLYALFLQDVLAWSKFQS